MGMIHFFERFILNPFSIFYMYVDCERSSNPLDLSHRSLFPEYRILCQGLSWRTVWTTKFSLLKSRNVIPILICHIHKIWNTTMLPLTFLYTLGSSLFCMKSDSIITSLKQMFQIRYTYFNP